MENSEEISLKELFENVVEDEGSGFNIAGSLEIAEYMNMSKKNCKEGVELLRKHLDSFSTNTVYKSVLVTHPFLFKAFRKLGQKLQYEISL